MLLSSMERELYVRSQSGMVGHFVLLTKFVPQKCELVTQWVKVQDCQRITVGRTTAHTAYIDQTFLMRRVWSPD